MTLVPAQEGSVVQTAAKASFSLKSDPSRAAAVLREKMAAWAPVRHPTPEQVANNILPTLKRHGLRINRREPATVKRLVQLLRRRGVTKAKAEEVVGMPLERWLTYSHDCALYWLTGFILEAHELKECLRFPSHKTRGATARVRTL